MTQFICPVCGQPLDIRGNSLVCGNRHCYDIARAGYVNLLMSNRSSAKRHGDDAAMLDARSAFLDGGHYAPLLDAVCACAEQYLDNGSIVVDAGCGEGYYTAGLRRYLAERGCIIDTVGIDISRDALKRASRRDRDLQLAVASVFNLPLAAKSADMLLCIFAPMAAEQFRRVLRRDGHLLCVVPLEQHLWELKQAVYDKPILNPSEPPAPDGFTLVNSRDVHYTLSLGGDDVRSLFAMTPYMYKTSARDQAKLAELDRLDTQVHFGIRVYKK